MNLHAANLVLLKKLPEVCARRAVKRVDGAKAGERLRRLCRNKGLDIRVVVKAVIPIRIARAHNLDVALINFRDLVFVLGRLMKDLRYRHAAM